MKQASDKYKFFIPAGIWAIVIFSLSSARTNFNPAWNLLSLDKLGHLCFYLIQTCLLIWAFAKTDKWTKPNYKAVIFSMLLASAYGAAIEYWQAFLPHRSFDYADMLANCVGAILGFFVFYLLRKKYFLEEF